MDWLVSPDAWLGRIVFERGVALLLLVSVISTANQFRALLSSSGLLPIPDYLRATSFWQRPSVFGIHYTDRFFILITYGTGVLAVLTLTGVTALLPVWAHALVWAGMWIGYLSIANVGQRWYGFLWEMLLCEVLFLGIFIGPAHQTPSSIVIWATVWLLFRVEFGAGMIKMRGGKEWRDLSALDYHHETQPMPGPLSWHFHHLPKVLHRAETAANHVVQLVVPFGLFFPQPVRSIAAIAIAATQAYLLLSGNFAWVNLLTIALALSVVDAAILQLVLPLGTPQLTDPGMIIQWLLIAFGVLSLALAFSPLQNLLSAHQKMNARYNPLLLGNSYGAFGTVGKVRKEVVIEGASADEPGIWLEYEFFGKPGALDHRPPQIAPYHLRLGWMLWFAALSRAYSFGWLDRLLIKLLQGDPATLKLVRVNPFPDAPPRWIRVRHYDYRFTTRAERRERGEWWARTGDRIYSEPRRLRT